MNVQLVAGIAVVVIIVVLAALYLWLRGSADERQSREAHEAAQERDAPVELGETYEVGITEFTDHHSGDRVAVGKVQGFVVFVQDVPASLDEGDVVRTTITSFNRDNTSADGTYDGRV